MKKSICILLIVLFFCGAVFANGTTEAEKSGVTTIQWWSPNWDETDSRKLISEFEELNSDIKVDLVVTDWDTYKAKTTTALTGKKAPELYSVLLTDVKPFAEKRLVSPVFDLCKEAGTDWSDMIPASIDIISYNNEAYAIPFRYDGSGVYYNKAAIKSVGYDEFPTTWANVIDMSDKLLEKGEYTPTAWTFGNQTNAVTRFAQILYTFGGNFMNDDNSKCTLNSKESIQALTFLNEMLEKGYAPKSSLELDNTRLRDTFGANQMAYYIGGPFDIDVLVNDYPQIDFGTATLPGINSMGTTTANGWCVIMAENTTNKEEAARFLSFLGEAKSQIQLTDSFPSSYTALKEPKFSTEYLIPFAKQLETSKAEPSYSRWAEMQPIIYEYMQDTFSGKISPAEACQKMANDITSLLGL